MIRSFHQAVWYPNVDWFNFSLNVIEVSKFKLIQSILFNVIKKKLRVWWKYRGFCQNFFNDSISIQKKLRMRTTSLGTTIDLIYSVPLMNRLLGCLFTCARGLHTTLAGPTCVSHHVHTNPRWVRPMGERVQRALDRTHVSIATDWRKQKGKGRKAERRAETDVWRERERNRVTRRRGEGRIRGVNIYQCHRKSQS